MFGPQCDKMRTTSLITARTAVELCVCAHNSHSLWYDNYERFGLQPLDISLYRRFTRYSKSAERILYWCCRSAWPSKAIRWSLKMKANQISTSQILVWSISICQVSLPVHFTVFTRDSIYAIARICHSHADSVCPSAVCLSVRPSVTRVYCIKPAERIIEIISLSDRSITLVFSTPRVIV